jgi:hypothetical protein
MASHDLRALGLSKTAACAVSLHRPLQLQIWARFPPPASLFPSVLRQPATHLLTQPSFHFLSPFEAHLPLPYRLSALRRCHQSFGLCPHLHKWLAVTISH